MNITRIAVVGEAPIWALIESGRPDARAPTAADNPPTRLYRANRAVRASPVADSASLACSSGRNTLTSPELGFSVPMNATTSSGHSDDRPAKARPVAVVSEIGRA